MGRRYAIRWLKLGRRCMHRVKVGRIRRLLIGRGILHRWRHGTRIIRALRMGEDTRCTVATGGEVSARDEPSDLRRWKV